MIISLLFIFFLCFLQIVFYSFSEFCGRGYFHVVEILHCPVFHSIRTRIQRHFIFFVTRTRDRYIFPEPIHNLIDNKLIANKSNSLNLVGKHIRKRGGVFFIIKPVFVTLYAS